MNPHTIFITGASGYVGTMLCSQYAKRDDVEKIIALDKEEMPDILKDEKKIVWIQANTADRELWQDKVTKYAPDIVIHAAWQIREMYGNQEEEWRWNVEGSKEIFNFAFEETSVKRLVYFSTAAIYGAYPENTITHRFTEDEPMREEGYSYGREKKRVEEILEEVRDVHKEKEITVSVVRPAAITGPRGRYMRVRFGLQSALSGQLKGSIVYRIVSALVSFVPATPWWVRQFIHEDDVVDIVGLLSFDERVTHSFEIFNITPPGDPVLAPHMADAVGKRVLPVTPSMVRFAFFIFWHITRGKIPTGKSAWRFYSYPIVLDGSKITKMYGYSYTYNSHDAFRYTLGRYESFVPEEKRVNPE